MIEPTREVTRDELHHSKGRDQAEQIGKPKTRNGERTLHIAQMPELLGALRALRDSQLASLGSSQVRDGWLALDEYGLPLSPSTWSARWTATPAAAGVRDLPLHSARHTAVTVLRNAGVPDHIVAAWAGHDEAIMRSVYTHAQAAQMTDAGRSLAEVIGQ